MNHKFESRFSVSCCVLIVSLLGGLITSPAEAGENYAFLVAVGDYDVKHLKPLAYTRNDILAFKEIIQACGFPKENIVLLHDNLKHLSSVKYLPNAKEIRKEFKLLLAKLKEDDTLIVAMAGHGIQFKGDESSYFCPADADLDDPERTNLIQLSQLYSDLNSCPARRVLLLVDACRNDPQTQLSRSRAVVDLKKISQPQKEPVPEGIVALFSCSAGEQAYEWPDLEHGVFFHHLLEGWRGAADDGDLKLSLDELITYTKSKTQSFARVNLAAVQRPQRLGEFSGTWIVHNLQKGVHVNSLGMKLKFIPVGEFLMGGSKSAIETARLFKNKVENYEHEYPQHRVKITKPFQMGIHEVTVGQFRQFVSRSGYKTDAELDGIGGFGMDLSTGRIEGWQPKYNWMNCGFHQSEEHPVLNITWDDASEFCKWLSKKEGKTYRLPTEAEWEYACRAGTTTIFQNGDDPNDLVKIGNVLDQTMKSKLPSNALNAQSIVENSDGILFTAPVGSFKPNAFGLYDMHGNLWEWCQDWYAVGYFSKSPVNDPQGPASGTHHIIRGGSWNGGAVFSRSATRNWKPTLSRSWGSGFRVVCEID